MVLQENVGGTGKMGRKWSLYSIKIMLFCSQLQRYFNENLTLPFLVVTKNSIYQTKLCSKQAHMIF